jgi:hypothetical protein
MSLNKRSNQPLREISSRPLVIFIARANIASECIIVDHDSQKPQSLLNLKEKNEFFINCSF